MGLLAPLKRKEAESKPQVARAGRAKMGHTFETSIEAGGSVLIENMGGLDRRHPPAGHRPQLHQARGTAHLEDQR